MPDRLLKVYMCSLIKHKGLVKGVSVLPDLHIDKIHKKETCSL